MRKTTLLFVALLFATLSTSAATGWFDDFFTLKVNGVETTNNYFLVDATPASGATQLNGAALGTVSSLELTSIDLKYWSDTQDRIGSALYYKITLEDGTTEVVAPVEVILEHVAIAGNDFQGTKTTTVNFTNAIVKNGNYKLHVWAKSWSAEGGQGDSYLSNSNANYVATFTVNRPVTIVGANGIADNSSFETLKAAFDSINAQPDQAGKDIEIKINGNTTETASAVLNQPATASWTSLTIYPTVAGVEISGDFASALLDLNGADNVTINGKLNKTGDPKSLTFIQSSAYNAARTIQLWNDAKSNTISFSTLKGSCPSSSGAVVLIATPSTDGNDMNTISYNDITRAGTLYPDNCIYVVGATGKLNDNFTIDNNNIYGFFIGETAYGIKIGGNNTDFTITNNSIYEPNEVTPTNSNKFYGMSIISTTAENVDISNNYIGGSEPMCGGLLKKSNAFSNEFNGIFLSLSATTNANDINNNFIKNIEWKNADVKKNFICVSAFGSAINLGTTIGNIISDIYWENGPVSDAIFFGYNITNQAGVVTVENSTFSNITITNTDVTQGSNFYGIYKSNSLGEIKLINNTIGSTSANSINLIGNSTANSQTAIGIFLDGTTRAYQFTVSDNTIQNINNSSSRADATNSAKGIYVSSTLGSGSIVNNKIYNISASDLTLPAVVAGIDMITTSSTTTATICANNMITLGNSNPGLVYGIVQNKGLAKVYHNSIYLAGSPAEGAFESSALVAAGSTAGREFLNNILYNTRSNTGTATSKHYAVKYAATTDLLSDYNVANYTGTGGLLGAVADTDYATGEDWVTATSLDTHSQVGVVNFTDAATGDLTLIGLSVQDAMLKVPSLAAVTTDILGTTRNTEFTYAGAHEAVLPFITTGLDKALMQAGVQISKTGVFIPLTEKTSIELYSMSGALIDKTVTNKSYSRALSSGAYILKINGRTVKFVK